DKEFSRQQKAQLQMRQWWANFNQKGEDFLFHFEAPPIFPYVSDLCLSPGVGVIWVVKTNSLNGTPPPLHALVFQTNLIGFYSSTRPIKLAFSRFDQQIKAFLSITATATNSSAAEGGSTNP